MAELSVSHLYNLWRSTSYRRRRFKSSRLEARPLPSPSDANRILKAPGYLRVDAVHQGQQDGKAGPYHINSLDTVTQWEVLGCCQSIRENHLVTMLEQILAQYPFRILGFHCDNGSEYLNHRVTGMPNKLLVEFTKSRPCRSTDNALMDGENGAVIRKHMGYGLSGNEWAAPAASRPSKSMSAGKRKRYDQADDYRTPYEKITSLPHWNKTDAKDCEWIADLL